MRLSEAMRKGMAGKKQVSGYFKDGPDGHCALGAAWNGIGGAWETRSGNFYPAGFFEADVMAKVFPVLNERSKCPTCTYTGTLRSIVPHLNNASGHGRHFEFIADWIEKEFEKPLEVVERENGRPTAVPAKEVMEFVGAPGAEEAVSCRPR